MVQVVFQIKLNPRFLRLIKRGGEDALKRASDVFLRDTAKEIRDITRLFAPKRTGFLRKMIKITDKKKIGRGVDRRADIRITSTAPYSIHVVQGVAPSIGDGSPGTGQYFGPGGFGFRRTRGFTGTKGFRSGSGFYPGFRGNNFIEKAAEASKGIMARDLPRVAINAYSTSYNKLGLRFGGV